jgi:uncharacterized repeat protein (TIGR01451 family)
VLVLSALPQWLQAQPTPAGTRIVNSAQVSYQADNGLSFSISSDADVMTVGQVAGVDVDPPSVAVGDPGTTVTFSHTLTNLGNAVDSFVVQGRSRAGRPVRVYLDLNGNAALDPTDALIAGPVVVAMGDMVRLLLASDVPAGAALRGTADTLQLVATSQFDANVTDSVTNVLQVRGAGVVVSLEKSVDRRDATVGDVLTYSVRFTASGGGTATNFRLSDLIPTGTTYVPGTMRLDGVPLSDSPGDDAGTFSAASAEVRLVLASVASGQTGVFAFQVRVVSP